MTACDNVAECRRPDREPIRWVHRCHSLFFLTIFFELLVYLPAEMVVALDSPQPVFNLPDLADILDTEEDVPEPGAFPVR